jgi:hypothetical protein
MTACLTVNSFTMSLLCSTNRYLKQYRDKLRKAIDDFILSDVPLLGGVDNDDDTSTDSNKLPHRADAPCPFQDRDSFQDFFSSTEGFVTMSDGLTAKPAADCKAVSKGFRKLAMQFHPDRFVLHCHRMRVASNPISVQVLQSGVALGSKDDGTSSWKPVLFTQTRCI